jgi:hypothetical protein
VARHRAHPLAGDSRTLTAPEIADVRGIHSSNVKRDAEEMVAAGLLERRRPASPWPGTRGRRATVAYFLPDAGADAVRARKADAESPGRMRRGMQVVFAGAGQAQIAELLEALAVGAALGQASWFALCEGEPQELAIAFDGEHAVEAASDLMAELRGAHLSARRAAVSEVLPADRLVHRARRTARAARKARMARATREAS